MDQNNKIKLLQDELQEVVKVAVEFSVSHTKIALQVGISYDYARQIRNGEALKRCNKENIKTIQDLIDAYRKEVQRKRRVLNSMDV